MYKNPKIKKAYVCLDSKYGKFSDDRKHITWNFENSLIESENSTNVVGNIRNITAMRLYSIMINAATLSLTVKRAAILIEEFSNQSFILPNGRKFHFISLLNDITNGPINLGERNAKVDVSTIRVGDYTLNKKFELLSGYKFNDAIYRFNYPITHVDTLTISVSDPINLFALNKYLQTGVTWTITQPDVLRLNLTFPEPHGCTGVYTSPNFSIFVDGLIAPDMQTIADYVNSKEHTIWEITDAYNITIKLMVDAKAGDLIATLPVGYITADPIIMPVPAEPVTVRFNSHRIIINLELDYLSDDPVESIYTIKEMTDIIPRAENSNLKYRYLMLDNYNTYDPESTTTKFTWLLNDKVPTLSKGYINVVSPIHNVVKARLGRMTFNYVLEAFIAAANNRDRFGFGFAEFASQAMINPLGNKFQFIEFLPEYDTNSTTTATTLSPFNTNRGWFRFREKINILDKLTLTMSNLITDEPVTILPAVVPSGTGTQSFGTSIVVDGVTFINYLTIPGEVLIGAVTLSGFTTDDPVTDAALIASYNTTHASLVNITGDLYIWPIDISGATFFTSPTSVTITFVGTKPPEPRFLGVLELLCEDDKVSNGINGVSSNGISSNGINGVSSNGINGVSSNGINGVSNNGINGVSSNVISIPRNLSPEYKYTYILLDTNNIDSNLSSTTKFGWNFIPNTKLSTGVINSMSDVKNLIGMRVFPITSNFIAPIIEPGKTLVNDVSNMGYNFTILIHEFAAQSFVGRNGFKYHFIFYPQLMNPTNPANSSSYTPADPYFEYTTSGKGNGWFWFRKPITTFSTITITMGNPFDLVKLDNITRVLIPIQLIFLNN